MANPSNQYMGMNYSYLYYPQQYQNPYPSLNQSEDARDQTNEEELKSIMAYIKNLRDPEKREDVQICCEGKGAEYTESESRDVPRFACFLMAFGGHHHDSLAGDN